MKAVSYFKWSGLLDLPSGKISDGIFLQAGPRGFCLSPHIARRLKQKHRCGLHIQPQAKQFACFALWNLSKVKNPPFSGFFILNGRGDWI